MKRIIYTILCFTLYTSSPYACGKGGCSEPLQEWEKAKVHKSQAKKKVSTKHVKTHKKAKAQPVKLEPSEATYVIEECQITPELWQLKTPPVADSTNNLRRKSGSTEFAVGTPIIIEGNILDSDCVPVSDATIEIWQANAKGGVDYYNADQQPQDVLDSNFRGSGSMIADNLGYYNFITVLPGSTGKNSAPHINVRVKHQDFQAFESVIYFENQAMNAVDDLLSKRMVQYDRNLLVAKEEKSIKNISEAGIVYRFNITLDGKNKFKKY